MTETVLKQRTTDWRRMRAGSVTASRFADVLTPAKTKEARYNGEWSETAKTYFYEKLHELLHGKPMDRFSSKATDWGVQWEADARQQAIPVIQERFGEEIGLPEGEFAFIQHPTEEYIGCSPDGIIGNLGLAEIKCPANGAIHLRTALTGAMPDRHQAQCQGSLWITGRQFYAFISFDPRLLGKQGPALFVTKVERDDRYIDDELAPRILQFRDWLLEEHTRICGGSPF